MFLHYAHLAAMCAAYSVNISSDTHSLTVMLNAYKELEVTHQMSQCEVLPVREERAPGGHIIISLHLCASHHTSLDLIMVTNMVLRLQRNSVKASEAAEKLQTLISMCTHMQWLCERLCVRVHVGQLLTSHQEIKSH